MSEDPVEAAARIGRVAAVVLAGGRASRLGQSKPRAIVGGETLLARTLAAVEPFPTVVVGPPDLTDIVDGRPGVSLARESPPFSGPVAAIAAGCTAHDDRGTDAEWFLLLACDHPRAPEVVQVLVEAASALDDAAAGVCLTAGGRTQWLCSIVRAPALRRSLRAVRADGGVESAPVRALLGPLDLRPINGADDLTLDVDTPDDLRRANERSPT